MTLLQGFLSAFSSPDHVGVDIGSFNIKVARVEKAQLKQGASLSLGVSKIGPEKTPAMIVEAIKGACADANIDAKNANASISTPTTITRYLIMPSMNKRDLLQALQFELEKHVPHDMSEMSYQYSIVSNLPNKQIMVLLAIAEKKMLQERISLVREAGLEVSNISIDPLATCKAFNATVPPGKDKNVVAVLDIGYAQSNLVVFSEETPYFSRDIPAGGLHFNQALVQKLGVDSTGAEKVKRDPSGKEKEIVEIISPHLHNIIDELSLSFNYCERCLQKTTSQLYLVGGEARITALAGFFEDNLRLKTSLWNPASNFQVPDTAGQEKQKNLGHLFAVAIGLGVG